MQLDREGFLQAQGVRLLGTDAAAISRAEDRELFKEAMAEIGQPVIASDIAETVEGALAVAEKIGYPVIVAARLHPGRRRRRRGQQSGGAEDHRRHRPGRLAHHPDPGERRPSSAGRRSSSRPCGQRGQRHRRLLYGEPGPGGCPHRRLHRGGPYPDPGGQGVPDAPQGVSGHHHPPGDRGRLQRTAGIESGELRVRGHRGEPPGVPFLGPGLQGHRLPHRQNHHQNRPGLHPGRDQKRHHRQDLRLL